MSKRFGRNQKRAMQAQIDEAIGETDALRTTAVRFANTIDGMEQQLSQQKREFAHSIEAAKRVIEVVASVNPASVALQAAEAHPYRTSAGLLI